MADFESRRRDEAAAEAALAIEQEYANRCTYQSDINELLPVLRALASTCRRVTEMGTRSGNSTIAFLAARPESLACYDIAECPVVNELRPKAEALGVSLSFNQRDVLLTEIDPTDLLFLDTKHTHDQVLGELSMHGNKAERFIVLHDTETFGIVGEDQGPGIMEAMRWWLRHNERWEVQARFEFNNGLVVLRRRPPPG